MSKKPGPNLWIGGLFTSQNQERIIRHLSWANLRFPPNTRVHKEIGNELQHAMLLNCPAEFTVVKNGFDPSAFVEELTNTKAGVVLRYQDPALGAFFDGQNLLALGMRHGGLLGLLPAGDAHDPAALATFTRMTQLLAKPVFPLCSADSARAELKAMGDLARWAGWDN